MTLLYDEAFLFSHEQNHDDFIISCLIESALSQSLMSLFEYLYNNIIYYIECFCKEQKVRFLHSWGARAEPSVPKSHLHQFVGTLSTASFSVFLMDEGSCPLKAQQHCVKTACSSSNHPDEHDA